MLLNEVQKQHRTIEEQTPKIQSLEERPAAIEAALQDSESIDGCWPLTLPFEGTAANV